jgi:hypothetical protein
VKIRQGFVSNSSSSSFILKNSENLKDSIMSQLKDKFGSEDIEVIDEMIRPEKLNIRNEKDFIMLLASSTSCLRLDLFCYKYSPENITILDTNKKKIKKVKNRIINYLNKKYITPDIGEVCVVDEYNAWCANGDFLAKVIKQKNVYYFDIHLPKDINNNILYDIRNFLVDMKLEYGIEFEDTRNFQANVKSYKRAIEKYEEIKNDINIYDLVEITADDSTVIGLELEHDIMPYIKEIICTISHH